MTRSIEEIERDIQEIEPEFKSIETKLSSLKSELRKAKSKQFIAANNIKKEDIHFSSLTENWFVYVSEFAKWIKTQKEQKRFAEWDTVIYFTSDILSGRTPEMPATIHDL